MPEAFAVFVVGAVSLAAWIAAWLQTRGDVKLDTPAELARLREHEAWLRQRLERAHRERWGADMTDGLAAELHATTQQLARARAAAR